MPDMWPGTARAIQHTTDNFTELGFIVAEECAGQTRFLADFHMDPLLLRRDSFKEMLQHPMFYAPFGSILGTSNSDYVLLCYGSLPVHTPEQKVRTAIKGKIFRRKIPQHYVVHKWESQRSLRELLAGGSNTPAYFLNFLLPGKLHDDTLRTDCTVVTNKEAMTEFVACFNHQPQTYYNLVQRILGLASGYQATGSQARKHLQHVRHVQYFVHLNADTFPRRIREDIPDFDYINQSVQEYSRLCPEIKRADILLR